jgi:transketolase
MSGELPAGWEKNLPVFKPEEPATATRSASGKVLNAVAAAIPNLVGGSADLHPSTNTYLKGFGSFSADHPEARNFHYGIREHGMGAATNGLALHGGLIPLCSTFFIFSDYMRPTIRLAALMKARSIFVFTHDSVGLGEDGPTHQPVEHLAAVRAIPGLVLLRPADANETRGAWRAALERKDGPTVLVLTRQNLPVLAGSGKDPDGNVRRGAYVIDESPDPSRIDAVLMATGSEVEVAVKARALLREKGVNARVVSMPSWELFLKQPREYRDQVLPPAVRARVSVEAGVAQGWCRFTGDAGASVSLERFGESAPGKTVLEKLGFNAENVAAKTLDVLAGLGKK